MNIYVDIVLKIKQNVIIWGSLLRLFGTKELLHMMVGLGMWVDSLQTLASNVILQE